MRASVTALGGIVLGLVGAGGAAIAGAPPAWAACCPVTGSAVVTDPSVAGALGPTLGAGGSSLATTGAAVGIAAAVGLAFLTIGALLIALAGTRGRWLPRPSALGVGVAVLVAATLLGGAGAAAAVLGTGTAAPGAPAPAASAAVLADCCAGVAGPTDPPVLPEAPLPVLLPLGAVAVAALVVIRRRRAPQPTAASGREPPGRTHRQAGSRRRPLAPTGPVAPAGR